MKRFQLLLLAGLLVLSSCGSYNSIDRFYNTHKNDDQVLAVRVPRVMLNFLSGLSPEMESLLGETRDLRFMQIPSATDQKTQYLNTQMNAMTGSSFIEVFRKNDALKRNVVSIRERGSSVREILIYNNDNLNGTILYFNGNFDPEKVRQMAKNEAFGKIQEQIKTNFSSSATPGITSD